MIKTKIVTRRVIDAHALYKDIGRRLKAARKKSGLTQSEAAIALGMSRVNLANIEGSTPQRVLLDHIYNAALVYKTPLKSLLPSLGAD